METNEAAQREQGLDIETEHENTPGIGSNKVAQPEELDEQDYTNINLEDLGTKFLPRITILDSQEICPSLSKFDLGDPKSGLDIHFLKEPDLQPALSPASLGTDETLHLQTDNDNIPSFDDADDGYDGLGAGLGLSEVTAFGEGGEVWAKDAELESQVGRRPDTVESGTGQVGEADGEFGCFGSESGQYGILLGSSRERIDHEDILGYFDNSTKRNWAGPEHWKIRKFKDTNTTTPSILTKRKEKDPFEIDFISPLEHLLADTIYTPASSSSSISLQKAQLTSKKGNLLPDDKHFNSHQLMKLFLKPRACLTSRKQGIFNGSHTRLATMQENGMDEVFWAQQNAASGNDGTPESRTEGDYDANFFQDDGLAFPAGLADDDDDDFADAREAFSPGVGNAGNGNGQVTRNTLLGKTDGMNDGLGSQLTIQSKRVRPDYVQYARVAKKVDVRRLKQEMWKGIGDQRVSNSCRQEFTFANNLRMLQGNLA